MVVLVCTASCGRGILCEVLRYNALFGGMKQCHERFTEVSLCVRVPGSSSCTVDASNKCDIVTV